MTEVNTKKEVKQYYRDKDIANKYVKERFSSPKGLYLHDAQVSFVNSAIETEKIKRLLEIACGPGRLSKDIKGMEEAYGMDSSEEMLKIARKNAAAWKFTKGDAFNLKFKPSYFDLVFCFRFLRHLKRGNRAKVYREVKKTLKKGGFFIFEAINYDKEYHVRKRAGAHKYKIYDKLYRKEELIGELEKNGFKVKKLKGVCNHFYTITVISKIFSLLHMNAFGAWIIRQIEKIPSKNPVEWAVLCQKR